MTRSRLAAVAALTAIALPVTAIGGEAPGDDYRTDTTCKTRHTEMKDFFKGRTEVMRRRRGGSRGSASAFVPVESAKVITKVRDLTTQDGDNVLDRKDADKTNDNGVAKTTNEFNNFGIYRVTTIVKVDGNVVEREQLQALVDDRESGKCEPAPAAG